MSTDEKYNVIFDLLAKAKEEGLDSARLHDEIRKELEAEDKTLDTFLGLVESLEDVIPKERQRYNAAIKALSKTSGLSRQDIVGATDNQLEGLKNVEKVVFSALAGFREELREMDSRMKKTKNELAELRTKIADLEKEEQEILGSMASWEKESTAVEQAVRKVFTAVGAEITEVRKKIEQYAAEEVAPQPVAPPESAEVPSQPVTPPAPAEVPPQPAAPPMSFESALRDDEEEKIILEFPSAPQESKWMKKCPLCGGQMHFHTAEALWKCYTCGNEEESEKTGAAPAPGPDNVQKSAVAPEPISAVKPPAPPEPPPVAESAAPPEPPPAFRSAPPELTPLASDPPAKRQAPGKKPCPVCRKQMNFLEKEKIWKCPACDYLIREF